MPSRAHPDTELAAALLGRWNDLIEQVRPGAQPQAAPYGEQLLHQWSEPRRRYHTLRHLDAMLAVVDALAEQVDEQGAAAVRLAAWFHDAVYAPDRSENEERSARLAERVLPELGVPPALTAEVARLVRLTADHDPAPGDANGALLCDADLAVLGGPPEAYAAYAAAVREEYAFVPDEDFRAGRAAVLRQLLALPELFRTEPARRAYGTAAHRNMTAELAQLAGR